MESDLPGFSLLDLHRDSTITLQTCSYEYKIVHSMIREDNSYATQLKFPDLGFSPRVRLRGAWSLGAVSFSVRMRITTIKSRAKERVFVPRMDKQMQIP